MNNPPYDTGKVKIGLTYTPPPLMQDDERVVLLLLVIVLIGDLLYWRPY